MSQFNMTDHYSQLSQQMKEQLDREQSQRMARLLDTDATFMIEKDAHYDDVQARVNPEFKSRDYSSLSKIDKHRAKKVYKEQKAKNTFVPAEKLETTYMKHVLESPVQAGEETTTQEDLMSKVIAGDCSHMQQLDPVLRNRAATVYMQNIGAELNGTPEEVLERFKQKQDPISAMMNPLLRMGISCVMNDPTTPPLIKDKYRKLDDLFSTEIMVATITKQRNVHDPGDSQISLEDWVRNTESQKFMFKTMLACQLGQLKRTDSKAKVKGVPWEGSIANAFAHCSRVMITLPAERFGHYSSQNQADMYDSFHRKAGFVKRAGATHTMSRRKKFGGSASEFKMFSPRSQYGMNVAVGGLGNFGIPGGEEGTERRVLKNDGSCGHIFMHFEEGTRINHSGMLIGFESDAFRKENQTGHTHDAKATGEFVSSFGGQRCDEIGDKYGGRTVDLSGCSTVMFSTIMKMADSAFDGLRTITNQAQRQEFTQKFEEITRKVCGKQMTDAEMIDLIGELQRFPGQTIVINRDTFWNDFRSQD